MADTDDQIGSGARRPVQVTRVRSGGWTRKRRATFLKALAETCNVRTATRAAGMTISGSVYDLRRRDPAFAQLWNEALAAGYERLETLLLQRALEGVNDIDLGELTRDDAAPATPAGHHQPGSGFPRDGSGLTRDASARGDVQLALALLNRRRDPAVRPTRRKQMTSDEVDALLVRKLDALARKLKPHGDE